jgi:hypothetical protein
VVKLYKIMSNGDIVFADFGVPSQAGNYVRQGYIVRYPMKRRKSNEDS